MRTAWRRMMIATLALVMVFGLVLSASASDYRLRGHIGGKAYGYQDGGDQNHIWLLESTSASVYKTDSPWSMHFSGGWVGDYVSGEGLDENDRFRFTRGYLRHGDLGSPVQAKLGRFFLIRGPAIGVLDGLDVNYRFKYGINIAMFGGVWGPLTRDFEFEDPESSMAFGGEIGWMGRDVLFAKKTHVALSYANIEREGEALRHRIGLQTMHRFTNSITWYNLAQFRVEGNLLRRFTSRLRSSGEMCSRMVEVSMLSAETPETSWFSDFEHSTYTRIRMSADRWIIKDSWGLGFDVAALMTEQNGYRVGPYAKFPFGRIGYRFYMGDQPSANGLWAQANYSPWEPFDVYAYGSFASYEWEAFDNLNTDANEVLSLYGGVKFQPPMWSNVQLKVEYQYFQTPEYDQDRRAMFGLRWGFDTAEVTR